MMPTRSRKKWDGPDLIFLDIDLTGNAKEEQENGLDVLKDIRKMPGGESPYIVIASGTDPQEASDRAFELGADSYLHKPFNSHSFVGVMKSYFAQRNV